MKTSELNKLRDKKRNIKIEDVVKLPVPKPTPCPPKLKRKTARTKTDANPWEIVANRILNLPDDYADGDVY